ncbi:MAG: hypothetical protein RBT37_04470 [Dissulfurispiraceae bacterium]|jgi:hypothetical protein|nr:hypothetical protein [Dissulfurispiraceae bacterium]
MCACQDWAVRRKKRYNHINISLKIKNQNEWEEIKALDWNEDGFNFFIPRDLNEKIQIFRKSLDAFEAEIRWCYKNDDQNVILELILNQLLFDQLKICNPDRQLAERVLDLSRQQSRILEKMRQLESMGYEIDDDNLLSLVMKYKSDNPLFRYGVRVESDIWKHIVDETLRISSVVMDLDKLGRSLSGLNKLADEDENITD